ncbi:MAG: PH domain-containing protein, partial [Chloroflexota bacterium]
LFIETVWPAGFMVLLGLVLIGLSFFGADQYAGIVVVIMILDGLWFIWLAEDWRNDTFQLSDTYVIDIDRLPFGFGESRKQARLDNIQNVEADRPNIIATILNYGNVEIETAGADAKIVFENVSNPQSIKNDVFKKQNKYESVQRQKRDERDRQKYAIALDVFVQESELNRINRRTPDFEQAIEDITDDILSQQSNE